MAIKHRMQKVMTLNTGEYFIKEVNTHYLTVPNCYQTCPVHTVILNFENTFTSTHLQLGGIRFFCDFLHICCFFMWLNFFLMASCNFLSDLRFGWFQASLNVWGASLVDFMSLATVAIVAKSIKKLLFFLRHLFQDSDCDIQHFMSHTP